MMSVASPPDWVREGQTWPDAAWEQTGVEIEVLECFSVVSFAVSLASQQNLVWMGQKWLDAAWAEKVSSLRFWSAFLWCLWQANQIGIE